MDTTGWEPWATRRGDRNVRAYLVDARAGRLRDCGRRWVLYQRGRRVPRVCATTHTHLVQQCRKRLEAEGGFLTPVAPLGRSVRPRIALALLKEAERRWQEREEKKKNHAAEADRAAAPSASASDGEDEAEAELRDLEEAYYEQLREWGERHQDSDVLNFFEDWDKALIEDGDFVVYTDGELVHRDPMPPVGPVVPTWRWTDAVKARIAAGVRYLVLEVGALPRAAYSADPLWNTALHVALDHGLIPEKAPRPA